VAGGEMDEVLSGWSAAKRRKKREEESPICKKEKMN
jgi:hypothetical protein